MKLEMNEKGSFPFTLKSSGENETFRLGREIAAFAFEGLCVLLSGELGSGKTVFARGFVSNFSSAPVRSPSFTLVNEYHGVIPIAHADLYRLEETDGFDIGLFDYQQQGYVILVEWGERWLMPPGDDLWHMDLKLPAAARAESDAHGDIRLIHARCRGERACRRLHECREHLGKNWRIRDGACPWT